MRLAPFAILTTLLLAIAIAFRIYALGRLPGINGDEAWYGVQAERILDGLTGSWRTPTGNLPGPIHLGLLLGLLKIFEPSLALLRVPSVICSLAAMMLAWLAGRRFDRETGITALLLMATLPANIAFARVGWDPSDSAMIDMAAAWFALSAAPFGSALLFALALLIHPSNTFMAPFLTFALFGAELDRRGWSAALDRSALHVALLCTALDLLPLTTGGGVPGVNLRWLLGYVSDPGAWRAFARSMARFLSGDTACEWLAGSGLGPEQGLGDALVAATLIGSLAVGAATFGRRRAGREWGVILGWTASLLAFFLLAGPDAITPPLQRYALCLVTPTVLMLAMLIGRIGQMRARAVTVVLAALMLAGFGARYLVPLAATGGTAHESVRTGPREPKQAALSRILAVVPPGERTEIVAPSWWLYWPLAYLAHGRSATVLGRVPPPGTAPARYWVVFTGDASDRLAATIPGARLRWTIAGGSRRDLLRIWWTPPVTQSTPASAPRP